MVAKIWLQNYPAAIPAKIDLDRYQSLPDLFDDIVAKFSNKPALYNLGCTELRVAS